MERSFPLIVRTALVVAASAALAGCPGETEPEKTKVHTEPASSSITGKTWLEPLDATSPERWLASRDAGTDQSAAAPATLAWREILSDADSRFDEPARMIANRAVQLEAMLREIGIDESVRDLLRDFAPLAATGSRRGFSELCQHYFNLRAQGDDRAAALKALRDSGPGQTAGQTP
ncbi:MAG TPA: hypothetical protein VIQ29_04795 [Ancylobacter sp.]